MSEHEGCGCHHDEVDPELADAATAPAVEGSPARRLLLHPRGIG